MIVNQKSFYAFKLFLDLILLNAAFLFAAWLAQPAYILYQKPYMFILMIGLNVLWYVSTKVTDFYNNLNPRSFFFRSSIIFKNALIQIMAAIFFIFAAKENLYTRNFIAFYFLMLVVFIFLRVLLFDIIQLSFYRTGKYVKNIIVIGANSIGEEFVQLLELNPHLGYKFIGFVDEQLHESNKRIICSFDKLNLFLEKENVDEAVITVTDIESSKLNEIINVCNKNALRVHIIPDYFQFLSKRFALNNIGGFPIITIRDEPLAEFQWRLIKRVFDICFTLVISVVILSWLVPLVAIIIKLTSRGPVFFIQERIGLKNEKFRCIKFRSMYVDNKFRNDAFTPTTKDDPRVTKFGRFLRRTNLDEIPQFWNVIKGEMSIVGPRPHSVAFNREYLKYFEAIKLRHLVKPGLTGWAQIHGLRGDVEDESENRRRTIERIKHDIWYIENWSLWLDVQIILITIWQMITANTKGH
ncbi:undecaprenyl-phosphate glucose phosphotransferase [Melioribacteraceae bacterium 4301-Me]|uniref:undecaprenyl-phosphate glucose phosphotransferase n=1 Tax=Pyranulibacter aquaticus TaxID=3163344 RepID=UPI003599325D